MIVFGRNLWMIMALVVLVLSTVEGNPITSSDDFTIESYMDMGTDASTASRILDDIHEDFINMYNDTATSKQRGLVNGNTTDTPLRNSFWYGRLLRATKDGSSITNCKTFTDFNIDGNLNFTFRTYINGNSVAVVSSGVLAFTSIDTTTGYLNFNVTSGPESGRTLYGIVRYEGSDNTNPSALTIALTVSKSVTSAPSQFVTVTNSSGLYDVMAFRFLRNANRCRINTNYFVGNYNGRILLPVIPNTPQSEDCRSRMTMNLAATSLTPSENLLMSTQTYLNQSSSITTQTETVAQISMYANKSMLEGDMKIQTWRSFTSGSNVVNYVTVPTSMYPTIFTYRGGLLSLAVTNNLSNGRPTTIQTISGNLGTYVQQALVFQAINSTAVVPAYMNCCLGGTIPTCSPDNAIPQGTFVGYQVVTNSSSNNQIASCTSPVQITFDTSGTTPAVSFKKWNRGEPDNDTDMQTLVSGPLTKLDRYGGTFQISSTVISNGITQTGSYVGIYRLDSTAKPTKLSIAVSLLGSSTLPIGFITNSSQTAYVTVQGTNRQPCCQVNDAATCSACGSGFGVFGETYCRSLISNYCATTAGSKDYGCNNCRLGFKDVSSPCNAQECWGTVDVPNCASKFASYCSVNVGFNVVCAQYNFDACSSNPQLNEGSSDEDSEEGNLITGRSCDYFSYCMLHHDSTSYLTSPCRLEPSCILRSNEALCNNIQLRWCLNNSDRGCPTTLTASANFFGGVSSFPNDQTSTPVVELYNIGALNPKQLIIMDNNNSKISFSNFLIDNVSNRITVNVTIASGSAGQTTLSIYWDKNNDGNVQNDVKVTLVYSLFSTSPVVTGFKPFVARVGDFVTVSVRFFNAIPSTYSNPIVYFGSIAASTQQISAYSTTDRTQAVTVAVPKQTNSSVLSTILTVSIPNSGGSNVSVSTTASFTYTASIVTALVSSITFGSSNNFNVSITSPPSGILSSNITAIGTRPDSTTFNFTLSKYSVDSSNNITVNLAFPSAYAPSASETIGVSFSTSANNAGVFGGFSLNVVILVPSVSFMSMQSGSSSGGYIVSLQVLNLPPVVGTVEFAGTVLDNAYCHDIAYYDQNNKNIPSVMNCISWTIGNSFATISFYVPNGVSAGQVNIVIKANTSSLKTSFVLIDPSLPSISSVIPSSGWTSTPVLIIVNNLRLSVPLKIGDISVNFGSVLGVVTDISGSDLSTANITCKVPTASDALNGTTVILRVNVSSGSNAFFIDSSFSYKKPGNPTIFLMKPAVFDTSSNVPIFVSVKDFSPVFSKMSDVTKITFSLGSGAEVTGCVNSTSDQNFKVSIDVYNSLWSFQCLLPSALTGSVGAAKVNMKVYFSSSFVGSGPSSGYSNGYSNGYSGGYSNAVPAFSVVSLPITYTQTVTSVILSKVTPLSGSAAYTTGPTLLPATLVYVTLNNFQWSSGNPVPNIQFNGNINVTIEGNPVTSASNTTPVVSSTTISFKVPLVSSLKADSDVNVMITNVNNCSSSTCLRFTFRYILRPQDRVVSIDSVNPTVISSTNYHIPFILLVSNLNVGAVDLATNLNGLLSVYIGDVAANILPNSSNNGTSQLSIKCVLPSLPTTSSPYSVIVKNANGNVLATAATQISLNTGATVFSVSPSFSYINRIEIVTIAISGVHALFTPTITYGSSGTVNVSENNVIYDSSTKTLRLVNIQMPSGLSDTSLVPSNVTFTVRLSSSSTATFNFQYLNVPSAKIISIIPLFSTDSQCVASDGSSKNCLVVQISNFPPTAITSLQFSYSNGDAGVFLATPTIVSGSATSSFVTIVARVSRPDYTGALNISGVFTGSSVLGSFVGVGNAVGRVLSIFPSDGVQENGGSVTVVLLNMLLSSSPSVSDYTVTADVTDSTTSAVTSTAAAVSSVSTTSDGNANLIIVLPQGTAGAFNITIQLANSGSSKQVSIPFKYFSVMTSTASIVSVLPPSVTLTPDRQPFSLDINVHDMAQVTSVNDVTVTLQGINSSSLSGRVVKFNSYYVSATSTSTLLSVVFSPSANFSISTMDLLVVHNSRPSMVSVLRSIPFYDAKIPQISSFYPSSTIANQVTIVNASLSNYNLPTGSTISGTIGTTNIAVINVLPFNMLQLQLPAQSAGSYDITLKFKNATDSSTQTAKFSFTVNARPTGSGTGISIVPSSVKLYDTNSFLLIATGNFASLPSNVSSSDFQLSIDGSVVSGVKFLSWSSPGDGSVSISFNNLSISTAGGRTVRVALKSDTSNYIETSISAIALSASVKTVIPSVGVVGTAISVTLVDIPPVTSKTDISITHGPAVVTAFTYNVSPSTLTSLTLYYNVPTGAGTTTITITVKSVSVTTSFTYNSSSSISIVSMYPNEGVNYGNTNVLLTLKNMSSSDVSTSPLPIQVYIGAVIAENKVSLGVVKSSKCDNSGSCVVSVYFTTIPAPTTESYATVTVKSNTTGGSDVQSFRYYPKFNFFATPNKTSGSSIGNETITFTLTNIPLSDTVRSALWARLPSSSTTVSEDIVVKIGGTACKILSVTFQSWPSAYPWLGGSVIVQTVTAPTSAGVYSIAVFLASQPSYVSSGVNFTFVDSAAVSLDPSNALEGSIGQSIIWNVLNLGLTSSSPDPSSITMSWNYGSTSSSVVDINPSKIISSNSASTFILFDVPSTVSAGSTTVRVALSDSTKSGKYVDVNFKVTSVKLNTTSTTSSVSSCGGPVRVVINSFPVISSPSDIVVKVKGFIASSPSNENLIPSSAITINSSSLFETSFYFLAPTAGTADNNSPATVTVMLASDSAVSVSYILNYQAIISSVRVSPDTVPTTGSTVLLLLLNFAQVADKSLINLKVGGVSSTVTQYASFGSSSGFLTFAVPAASSGQADVNCNLSFLTQSCLPSSTNIKISYKNVNPMLEYQNTSQIVQGVSSNNRTLSATFSNVTQTSTLYRAFIDSAVGIEATSVTSAAVGSSTTRVTLTATIPDSVSVGPHILIFMFADKTVIIGQVSFTVVANNTLTLYSIIPASKYVPTFTSIPMTVMLQNFALGSATIIVSIGGTTLASTDVQSSTVNLSGNSFSQIVLNTPLLSSQGSQTLSITNGTVTYTDTLQYYNMCSEFTTVCDQAQKDVDWSSVYRSPPKQGCTPPIDQSYCRNRVNPAVTYSYPSSASAGVSTTFTFSVAGLPYSSNLNRYNVYIGEYTTSRFNDASNNRVYSSFTVVSAAVTSAVQTTPGLQTIQLILTPPTQFASPTQIVIVTLSESSTSLTAFVESRPAIFIYNVSQVNKNSPTLDQKSLQPNALPVAVANIAVSVSVLSWTFIPSLSMSNLSVSVNGAQATVTFLQQIANDFSMIVGYTSPTIPSDSYVNSSSTVPVVISATNVDGTTQTASGTHLLLSELVPVIIAMNPRSTSILTGGESFTLSVSNIGSNIQTTDVVIQLVSSSSSTVNVSVTSIDTFGIITCQFPAATAGDYKLTIRKTTGTATGSTSGIRYINPGAIISNVSPSAGVFNEKTFVKLYVKNLNGAPTETLSVLGSSATTVTATRSYDDTVNKVQIYSATLPVFSDLSPITLRLTSNNVAPPAGTSQIGYAVYAPRPSCDYNSAPTRGGQTVVTTVYKFPTGGMTTSDIVVVCVNSRNGGSTTFTPSSVTQVSSSSELLRHSVSWVTLANQSVGFYTCAISSVDLTRRSAEFSFSFFNAVQISYGSYSSWETYSLPDPLKLYLSNVPSAITAQSMISVTQDNTALAFSLSGSGNSRRLIIHPVMHTKPSSSPISIAYIGPNTGMEYTLFNLTWNFQFITGAYSIITSSATGKLAIPASVGMGSVLLRVKNFGAINVTSNGTVEMETNCLSSVGTSVSLTTTALLFSGGNQNNITISIPSKPTATSFSEIFSCTMTNVNSTTPSSVSASFSFYYFDDSVVMSALSATSSDADTAQDVSFSVTNGTWPLTTSVGCETNNANVTLSKVTGTVSNSDVQVAFTVPAFTGQFSDISGTSTTLSISCSPLSARDRIVTFGFSIYQGLTPVGAAFDPSYLNIDITFNRATDRVAGTVDTCSTVLSSTTTGFQTCIWLTSSVFRIKLSNSAIILPGETITFATGIIASALFSYKMASKSVIVVKSSSSPIMFGVVQVVSEIDPCVPSVKVRLNSSGSTGGRTPTFSWIASCTACTSEELSPFALYIKSISTSTFDMNTSDMLFGKEYTLEVTVADFLGQLFKFNAVTTRKSVSSPTITIPRTVAMYPSSSSSGDLVLLAQASFSSCSTAKPTLQMSFVVASGTGTIVTNGPTMTLKANSVVGGSSVIINATVYDKDNRSLTSTAVITVTVLLPSIKAIIRNGQTVKVSNKSDYILDASLSAEDLTGSTSGLTFAWSCSVADNSSLQCPYFNPPTDPSVSLFKVINTTATNVIPSGVYIITVTVTKVDSVTSSRSQQTSTTMTVVTDSVPIVAITSNIPSKVSASSALTIVGTITNQDVSDTILWTASPQLSVASLAAGVNTGISGLSLGIIPNVLREGFTYSFTMTVSRSSNNSSSFASVSTLVNQAPRAGAVTVSPSVGVSLTTAFSITCDQQWSDDDISTSSLLYDYYYSVNGNDWTGFVTGASNTLNNVLLPTGGTIGSVSNTVRIKVVARDQFGDSALATVDVIVSPPADAISALNSLLSTQLVSATASQDTQSVNNIVSSGTSAVNNASASISGSRRLLAVSASALQSIRESLQTAACNSFTNLSVNSNVITQGCSQLKQLSSGSQAEYTQAQLLSMATCMKTLVEAAVTETTMTTTDAQVCVDAWSVSETLFLKSGTPNASDNTTWTTAKSSFFRKITAMVLSPQAVGSAATTITSSDTFLTLIARKSTTTDFNTVTSIGISPALFNISGVTGELVSKNALSAGTVMYRYILDSRPYLPSVALTSDYAVSSSLGSLTLMDSTGSDVSVTGLTNGISVSIATTSAMSKPGTISTWSNSSYSGTGCVVTSRTVGTLSTTIVAQCDHFGDFVVQNSPSCAGISGVFSAGAVGTSVTTLSNADIVTGGTILKIVLTCYTFVTVDSTFVSTISPALASTNNRASGWTSAVVPALSASAVSNFVLSTDKSTVSITLPAVSGYHINQSETLSITVPKALMSNFGSATTDIAASGTVVVSADTDKSSFLQTSLTIKTSFTSLGASSSITYTTFATAFQIEVAAALRIPSIRVIITSIAASTIAGETVVVFQLFAKTSLENLDLFNDLLSQVQTSTSLLLKSTNTVTNLIDTSILPAKQSGITAAFNVTSPALPNSTTLSSSYLRTVTFSIIISVTMDTWLDASANGNLFLQKLQAGITGSSGTAATGFQMLFLNKLLSSSFVTNSDLTQLTITFAGSSSYVASADEVISILVDKSLLAASTVAPVLKLTVRQDAKVTLGRTTYTAEQIASGGQTLVFSLAGATFNPITTTIRDAIASSVVSSLAAQYQSVTGWTKLVVPVLKASSTSNLILTQSNTVLTFLLPAVPGFFLNQGESLVLNVPFVALANYNEVIGNIALSVSSNAVDAVTAKKVRTSLVLTRDISTYYANAGSFNTSFIASIASALRISTDRVAVTQVTPSSLKVQFTLAAKDGINANNLLIALSTYQKSQSSVLYSQISDVDPTKTVALCQTNGLSQQCSNNGTCMDGICSCDLGWSGSACSTVQLGGGQHLSPPLVISLITVLLVCLHYVFSV